MIPVRVEARRDSPTEAEYLPPPLRYPCHLMALGVSEGGSETPLGVRRKRPKSKAIGETGIRDRGRLLPADKRGKSRALRARDFQRFGPTRKSADDSHAKTAVDGFGLTAEQRLVE